MSSHAESYLSKHRKSSVQTVATYIFTAYILHKLPNKLSVHQPLRCITAMREDKICTYQLLKFMKSYEEHLHKY